MAKKIPPHVDETYFRHLIYDMNTAGELPATDPSEQNTRPQETQEGEPAVKSAGADPDEFLSFFFGPNLNNQPKPSKQIRIDRQLYEILSTIAILCGAGDSRKTSYLNNIIRDHLRTYRRQIEAVYRKGQPLTLSDD